MCASTNECTDMITLCNASPSDQVCKQQMHGIRIHACFWIFMLRVGKEKGVVIAHLSYLNHFHLLLVLVSSFRVGSFVSLQLISFACV